MKDLRNLYLHEIEEYLEDKDIAKYRAKQIFSWVHEKRVESIDEMSNISNDLKEELKKDFYIAPIELLEFQESKLDNTIKYLFRIDNDIIIETVLMRHDYGDSLCVSTQDGCKMSCSFCSSTIDGFRKNLDASDILAQVYKVSNLIDKKINNVVLMGIGEPLDNYSNVVRFIRLVSEENGYNLSQRRLSLSTCGIIENIYQLADENLKITLTISLHAANNELRETLMPVARRYSIEELIKSSLYYFNRTKRRVSFEYIMIDEVNDRNVDAYELANLLKGKPVHVNLIPYNNARDKTAKESPREKLQKFRGILQDSGIEVTIRKSLGTDIDGACGQLKRRELDE